MPLTHFTIFFKPVKRLNIQNCEEQAQYTHTHHHHHHHQHMDMDTRERAEKRHAIKIKEFNKLTKTYVCHAASTMTE